MNTRYQTRLQMRNQTNTVEQKEFSSHHCYNTRLNNRVKKVGHNYNTRQNPQQNVFIDFDEASKEWNNNKSRVGQSYKYI